jgi:hypothetical protein
MRSRPQLKQLVGFSHVREMVGNSSKYSLAGLGHKNNENYTIIFYWVRF